MSISKLDVLFLACIGLVVAFYNFGAEPSSYYNMHSKLHQYEGSLPRLVINPLAEIASIKKADASAKKPESSEGEEDDGGDVPELDGAAELPEGEEDDDEPPQDEEGSGQSQSEFEPSAEELEAYEASKRKAAEEARKMLLEDTILSVKLKEMRKSLEKGLLPADTMFSFHVDTPPDQLTEISTFDEEEADFAAKLSESIEGWKNEIDRIDRAATGKPAEGDETVSPALIKDQEDWLSKEMARLRAEIRANQHSTLSGATAHSKDFYDEMIRESREANAPGSGQAVTQSSQPEKKTSPKSVPKIVVHGAIAKYAQMVSDLEHEISWWAHTDKKSIYLFGNTAYVHRDYDTYAKAFSSAGFAIDKRKKDGALSSKLISGLEQPVLICLALKNDDCFTSAGQSKMKRYQRINRITGLRAVLWSKDSFCKTISSGTKGEPMFSDYTFSCWIFPLEWASAREYAQSHPDASYIIKPLTMGGGKGISVVDGEKELSKLRFKTHIVQNYLGTPHLIKQHKWDLRTYVLVTSTVPMRAYVYSRGLVRFASSPYDPNARNGGKKSQYLTNTSINKKYVKQNVTDITWSFSDLQSHLDGEAAGTYNELFSRMQAAISIVFLSAEQEWRRYYSSHGESCATCFQIMGVDLIVDEMMRPRVIEVNGQPNMKLSEDKKDHYSVTKLSMMKDMIHAIFLEESVSNELLHALEGFDAQVLQALTQQEWTYLLEYIKERKHRGQWKKVYPNVVNSKLHSAFLEQQKRNPARLALHDVLMHLEEVTLNMGKT